MVSVTERARRILRPLEGGPVKVTVVELSEGRGAGQGWTTYEGRLTRVGLEEFEVEGRVTNARHPKLPYPEGRFLMRMEDVREIVHGNAVTIVKS